MYCLTNILTMGSSILSLSLLYLLELGILPCVATRHTTLQNKHNVHESRSFSLPAHICIQHKRAHEELQRAIMIHPIGSAHIRFMSVVGTDHDVRAQQQQYVDGQRLGGCVI